MVTPALPTDDFPTRGSDSLQAAYFRGALADHRALIGAEIGRNAHTLNALTTRSDAVAISRLRRDIRAAEAECRELDRMIRALDRRFATAWANQT
jgi:hypothetical protein